ncbi:MAG: hypothetical protein KME52_31480 [Desmonostoc geniculatum HA4340-LM1]|nr:hypothetical protein [Desmonostoc geniculatum HA4340-LM1]
MGSGEWGVENKYYAIVFSIRIRQRAIAFTPKSDRLSLVISHQSTPFST